MADTIDIISTGARTPVGLASAPAAAAVRANINRFAEHPFMIDQVGEPMVGSMDALLDPAVMGPERLLAMAESALVEACTPLENKGAFKLPVFLAPLTLMILIVRRLLLASRMHTRVRFR